MNEKLEAQHKMTQEFATLDEALGAVAGLLDRFCNLWVGAKMNITDVNIYVIDSKWFVQIKAQLKV